MTAPPSPVTHPDLDSSGLVASEGKEGSGARLSLVVGVRLLSLLLLLLPPPRHPGSGVSDRSPTRQ